MAAGRIRNIEVQKITREATSTDYFVHPAVTLLNQYAGQAPTIVFEKKTKLVISIVLMMQWVTYLYLKVFDVLFDV